MFFLCTDEIVYFCEKLMLIDTLYYYSIIYIIGFENTSINPNFFAQRLK